MQLVIMLRVFYECCFSQQTYAVNNFYNNSVILYVTSVCSYRESAYCTGWTRNRMVLKSL